MDGCMRSQTFRRRSHIRQTTEKRTDSKVRPFRLDGSRRLVEWLHSQPQVGILCNSNPCKRSNCIREGSLGREKPWNHSTEPHFHAYRVRPTSMPDSQTWSFTETSAPAHNTPGRSRNPPPFPNRAGKCDVARAAANIARCPNKSHSRPTQQSGTPRTAASSGPAYHLDSPRFLYILIL